MIDTEQAASYGTAPPVHVWGTNTALFVITPFMLCVCPGSQLGGVKLSRDQQLLAYSLEMEDGSEQYCCVARHIATGAPPQAT